MRKPNVGQALNAVVNVLVILVLGYVMLRPDGSVGALVKRKLVDRRARASVERHWGALVRNASMLHPGDTRVTVVEFADYECPFCRKAHQAITKSTAEYGGHGIAYRHLPLSSIHAAATGAALAAICAEAQGKFVEMHDRLYTTDMWRTDTNWVREAAASGVPDTLRYRKCLSMPSTQARLDADLAFAGSLGIRSTPAFVSLAGGIQRGALTDQQLLELRLP